jgi:hypothetical protein
MNNRTAFRIGLAVAFVVGLFLAFPWKFSWMSAIPSFQGLLREVVPKLGDALMIAPLVIVAIEIAASGELLQDFVKDVSHHIIGHLLPPELRDHIKGYLSADFVRPAWFVEYRISEWPDHPGFVAVKILSEYTIENRASGTRRYEFAYTLDKSWFPTVGKAKILHVRATADERAIVDHDARELADLIEESTAHLRFSEKVDIPKQPHGNYRFVIESLECLPDGFATPFVASVPVLYIILRVFYPKDRFAVDIELSFAEQDGALVRSELQDGTEWTIKTPMLPGQAFFTRWTRREVPHKGERHTVTKRL